MKRSNVLTDHIFKRTWTGRICSFMDLEHRPSIFTPTCEDLIDLGHIEIFWTNSIVHYDLLSSSRRSQREEAEQGIESWNSNSPEGVGEKKACWAPPPQCWMDSSSLGCWVTPCWCFSLPFKVEDAVTYYLSGSTTKSCLSVAWLAARSPAHLPSADFLHILDGWF